MVTVYGIPNCDTIKKTRNWLEQHGIDYEFHDYKKQGCSESLAREFVSQFPYQEVINRRGTSWRKLPEATRDELDESLAVKLMIEQPSLIKRPIVNSGKTWILGFDADKLASLG